MREADSVEKRLDPHLRKRVEDARERSGQRRVFGFEVLGQFAQAVPDGGRGVSLGRIEPGLDICQYALQRLACLVVDVVGRRERGVKFIELLFQIHDRLKIAHPTRGLSPGPVRLSHASTLRRGPVSFAREHCPEPRLERDCPVSQENTPLARTLGLSSAIGLGLGAMIGAGIFVLTGSGAGEAGPALGFLPAG